MFVNFHDIWLILQQYLQYTNGSIANLSTGTKDRNGTGIKEELVILSRYHTAHNHHNVFATIVFKFFYNLRDKGFMPCR